MYKRQEEVGGKLATEKSEIITCTEAVDGVDDAKSEFVWLGFSFRMTVKDGLVFTTSKMDKKVTKLFRYCSFIGNLNMSKLLKLKIYKTYVRPIIEIFSMCKNVLKEVSVVQSKLLCVLMGVSRKYSLARLLKKCQTPSVDEIWHKIARQIKCKFEKTMDEFDPIRDEHTVTTRSGSQTYGETTSVVNRDFFTSVWITCNSTSSSKPNKKPPKLNEDDLQKWCKQANKFVKTKVARSSARK